MTALEARAGDDLSLSYVHQALIHEEQKIGGSSCPTDGPQLQVDQKALAGWQPRQVRCYGCGEVGHIHRFCPHKKTTQNASPAKEKEGDERVGAFAASVKLPGGTRWLVDSGASSHMTQERNVLTDYKAFDTPQKVSLGDGHVVHALGVGNVHLRMVFKVSQPKENVMYKVLYVPSLTCNLFSVRAAAEKGNTVNFGFDKCWIRDKWGSLRGMGLLNDKVYELKCECVIQEHERASVASDGERSLDLWHQRLGHVGEQQLKEMVSKEMVRGVRIPKTSQLLFCEGCVEGKMKHKPFQPVGEIRSTRLLERVHSDVCGPLSVESIGRKKYFVTFIDDYSRCCRVYFMRQKNEVFEKFKEFEALVTNDTGSTIGVLRSDNGGEYITGEFESYLKLKGIRHELTVPPEQNGVAERMNRTLMESARSMLAHAGLPHCYWAEAVSTAAYLKNRTATTAFEKVATPYERWYGRKPNISNLRVFGCYAHIPDSQRTKLDEKMRFVGYSIQSKGYRLLDEKTRNVLVRRDVVFNETDFGQPHPEARKESLVVEMDEGSSPVVQEQQVTPDPRPQETHVYPDRSRQAPVRYGIDEYVSIATSDDQLSDNVNYRIEPSTLKEANTVAIPAEVSVQLQKDDSVSTAVEANHVQSMVGSLLVATRHDIAQAVGAVAKFMVESLWDTPAQSGLEMGMIVIQQLEVCSSWQEDQ